MRLKFSDAVADRERTNHAWKLLIPQAESNISWGRVSVLPIDAYERVVQQDRRSKQLAEMSLGELLYYALVAEGTIAR